MFKIKDFFRKNYNALSLSLEHVKNVSLAAVPLRDTIKAEFAILCVSTSPTDVITESRDWRVSHKWLQRVAKNVTY